MNINNKTLVELKNIGKTVASRLHNIGIHNKEELKNIGSAKAYYWMSQENPKQHLPVCYYLYSLEGALQNKHWKEFTDNEKLELRLKAGLAK